jgi:hypothetical protein
LSISGIGETESVIKFFEINIKNYPPSPSVYKNLVDLYSKTGSKGKAKILYEKADSIKTIDKKNV